MSILADDLDFANVFLYENKEYENFDSKVHVIVYLKILLLLVMFQFGINRIHNQFGVFFETFQRVLNCLLDCLFNFFANLKNKSLLFSYSNHNLKNSN